MVQQVIVIGGGIGGLCAAIALRGLDLIRAQCWRRSTVRTRSSSLGELG